jgi:hypothetical protein
VAKLGITGFKSSIHVYTRSDASGLLKLGRNISVKPGLQEIVAVWVIRVTYRL